MKTSNKPDVRVLKTATCSSLSGKSKLTYNVGGEENAEGVCTSKSEIHFRIHANSNSGYFNGEWVGMSAIQPVLDKAKTLTCFTLGPLFRGKSINTAGFLLAVLKNEGLVRAAKDDKRSYERGDPKAFLAGAKVLLESPAATKPRARTLATKDEPIAAQKKPAATPKKTASKSSAKKKD